jgi:hypothetical protein
MNKVLKFPSSALYGLNISQALNAIVDEYMDELRTQSPFFKLLRQGAISAGTMAHVLATIIYALRYTPVHLQRAEAMARERGNLELANFFKNKALEEFRHEDWAIADLKSLPCSEAEKRAALPVSGVVGLMDYIGEVIKANPLNYLAYIAMNEHVAATVFPGIIEQLAKMCRIDSSHVTVLSKHAELDQQHSNDDEMILEKLFGAPSVSPEYRRKMAEFFSTLYQSLAYYEQMFADFSAVSKKSA